MTPRRRARRTPLTWEELEAILLWKDIGFPEQRIADSMAIPMVSVVHQIHRGKKAHALIAKLQVWKDYDRDAELTKFLTTADFPNEGHSLAGQEGQELHPENCTELCCAGARFWDLGRLDAALQQKGSEVREPARLPRLDGYVGEAAKVWQDLGYSTDAIASGMRLRAGGTKA